MQRLKELLQQEITWIAAEHNDHAPHRHVHVVAMVRQKLNSLDFKYLRLAATEAALFQRHQLDLVRGIRRERVPRYPRYQGYRYRQATGGQSSLSLAARHTLSSGRGRGGGSPAPRLPTCYCYHCGQRQPKLYLESAPNCLHCGARLLREKKILPQTQEAQWEP
jgi:hypothetical protein